MLKNTVLLLLLFIGAFTSALGQGAERGPVFALQNSGGYAKVIPFAQVTLCAYNTQQNCNNPTGIYSDPALDNPISYPFYADLNGNYSYYAPAGTYIEQVCAPQSQCYYYQITLQVGGATAGVSSINTASGAFTFEGNAVSCLSTVCTFSQGAYLPLTGGTLTGPLTATQFNGPLVGNASGTTATYSNLISSSTPLVNCTAPAYGAVGNGTTDNTAAAQSCINAATALGGIAYFPPGVYNFTGAIQSSCDAILCIPTIHDTGPPAQVKILGSTHIRQDANGTPTLGGIGTVFTTQVTGTDAQSAIIGVPEVAGNASNFDNLDLYINDIDFRTYSNPDIGCVNAYYSAGFSMVYFRCDVGLAYVGTVKVEPTNTVTGVELPGINNDTLAELRHGEISGYWAGVGASEHADIQFVTIAYGIYGIQIGQGFHPAVLNHFVSQENGTPIRFVVSSIPVTFEGLDIEYDANNIVCPISNSWCWSGTDISDPSDYGHGFISYTKVIAGTGTSTTPIVVTGGENLNYYDQTNDQWSYRSLASFRSEFTVGGLPSPNADKIYPSISAEYFDLDTLISGYDPTGGQSADPNRAGIIQVYSGGSGNTLGTTPWNLRIETVGGSTILGNSTGTVSIYDAVFPQITGSTQCLNVNTSGTLAGVGAACYTFLGGATGVITGTSLSSSCDSGTVTVTGATVGHAVSVSTTDGTDIGGAFNIRASVTAANTVTVYVCGTGTPPSKAYNVATY